MTLTEEIERVLALSERVYAIEDEGQLAAEYSLLAKELLDLWRGRGPELLEVCRNLELGNKLVAILSYYCGERGDPEGAVETLNRIIMERAAERGSK